MEPLCSVSSTESESFSYPGESSDINCDVVSANATTVLNGTVCDGEEADDANSELGYEFVYTVSDVDEFKYEFEAYPVSDKSQETKHRESRANPADTLSTPEIEPASAYYKSILAIRSEVECKREKPVCRTACFTNERTICRENLELLTDTEEPCELSITAQRSNNESKCNRKKPLKSSKVNNGGNRMRKASAGNKFLAGGSSRTENGHDSRKISTTTTSEDTRRESCISRQSAPSADYNRRKSVNYDPALEKASAYLHEGGKGFSRAKTSLIPMKYGLKNLQMSYTETNLQTNQSIIFLDLLKRSHKTAIIRDTGIRNIERRLQAKRDNPLYSTSFYEHKHLPDPLFRNKERIARSVAQKKQERKKKIKKLTNEIKTGYVPTCLTMKILSHEEVEDIAQKCRYLRCQSP